ncbi:31599_t:CDS:2, partial [Racocetra persica]
AYLTDKQRQRRQKIKAQITNQDQVQFNKYYQANSIQQHRGNYEIARNCRPSYQGLLKYRPRKMRKEKILATALEQQTKAAQQCEKEIQRAKYHEERGKEDCHCSYCEQKRALRAEVEAEREQMWKDYEKADRAKERKEKGKKRVKDYCMGCSELRLLSADGKLIMFINTAIITMEEAHQQSKNIVLSSACYQIKRATCPFV